MITLFWLGFALAASPGPDFFLMVKHTLAQGRGMGYLTLAGNRLSLICHMTFAIFGLSLVLQESATVFLAIRILGAVYLIYLGCKNLAGKLKGRKVTTAPEPLVTVTPLQAFQRGFLNNLLNPKVSLFFLSIFPQLATVEQLSTTPFKVALMFFIGNCCWYVPIIFIIGLDVIRKVVQRIQKGLDLLFGTVFIGYGLNILWDVFRKLRSVAT